MLNTDTLLQLLSDGRRRRLLRGVEADGQARVDSDGPQTELELYHVHLPKLEAAELVKWDRESGVVTRGEEFDTAERMLTHIDELQSGAVDTASS